MKNYNNKSSCKKKTWSNRKIANTIIEARDKTVILMNSNLNSFLRVIKYGSPFQTLELDWQYGHKNILNKIYIRMLVCKHYNKGIFKVYNTVIKKIGA